MLSGTPAGVAPRLERAMRDPPTSSMILASGTPLIEPRSLRLGVKHRAGVSRSAVAPPLGTTLQDVWPDVGILGLRSARSGRASRGEPGPTRRRSSCSQPERRAVSAPLSSGDQPMGPFGPPPQSLAAVWNAGEPMLTPGGSRATWLLPELLVAFGSAKLGTPWLRMHLANLRSRCCC